MEEIVFNNCTIKTNHEKLGNGSFGYVYESVIVDNNSKKETLCATKIAFTKNDFAGILNYNELEMLLKLSKSRFIVKMLAFNITEFDNLNRTNDFLNISLEHAKSNLTEIVKMRKYTYKNLKNIMADILLGLDHMHKKGISHRDLKTSNILVFEREGGHLDVKLADFGLSTILPYKDERIPEVHTILYRAPEVMCSVKDYNNLADIWCIGILFVELFIGAHLFKIYNNEITVKHYLEECLKNTCDNLTLETQEKYRLSSDDRVPILYDLYKPRTYQGSKISYLKMITESFTNVKSKHIGGMEMPPNDELVKVDKLINLCLKYDYNTRPTCTNLLKNVFFEPLYEYIDVSHKKQFNVPPYDVIYFNIDEEKNNIKYEYFKEYIKKVNCLNLRRYFIALDLVNKYLTVFYDTDLSVKDICACCCYIVHKYFIFSYRLTKPYKFFPHKKYNKNTSKEELLELDKFIYDFELEILSDENNFLPIVRPTVYDMQNKFKDNITKSMFHNLTYNELVTLFKEVCKINIWDNKRSYRYMYRVLYKKLFDNSFEV